MLKAGLVIVMMFLSFSQAIHTVRGGGFGEMKAQSAFSSLNTLLGVCLNSSDRCHLSPNQQNQISRLSTYLKNNPITLEISPTGPTYFQKPVLHVGSVDLYRNGLSRAYGDILGILVSVLVKDGLQALDWQWALYQFRGFNEDLYSIPVGNQGLFHILKLKGSQTNAWLIQTVAFENSHMTQDLSTEVLKTLGCPTARWNSESWVFDARASVVRVQLTWVCGSSRFTGEMRFWVQNQAVSRIEMVRKTPF